MTGVEATRENILRQISQVECIHFATHVSWKLSALILSPGDLVESSSKHFTSTNQPECQIECDDISSEMSTYVNLHLDPSSSIGRMISVLSYRAYPQGDQRAIVVRVPADGGGCSESPTERQIGGRELVPHPRQARQGALGRRRCAHPSLPGRRRPVRSRVSVARSRHGRQDYAADAVLVLTTGSYLPHFSKFRTKLKIHFS